MTAEEVIARAFFRFEHPDEDVPAFEDFGDDYSTIARAALEALAAAGLKVLARQPTDAGKSAAVTVIGRQIIEGAKHLDVPVGQRALWMTMLGHSQAIDEIYAAYWDAAAPPPATGG